MTTHAETARELMVAWDNDDLGCAMEEAIAAALARANRPEWSTEKPKKTGWYWWRDGMMSPEIGHVYLDELDGELRVDWTSDCDGNGSSLSKYYDGEWAPVVMPVEKEGT